MPFEFRNERALLESGGITLSVADLVQVDFADTPDRPMGKRYIVHDGETMIQSSTLERAEVIMLEVLNGTRSLTSPAAEPGDERSE